MRPQLIGEYELGPIVGTGTVGSVYRARHSATGQRAVVKLLQADVAKMPDVQRRFVREVAVAEKLNHPNIVRHYDAGLDRDRIYYVMELVECGTLRDVLDQRGALPWRDAVEVAIQLCAALEHAHAHGVIHRDLKPANLFLSSDGKVKVGDFGLARDLNRHRLTFEGETVGTARYMAPEQVTGDDDLTGAVDLYALGCILFEMLVGRPPLDGRTIVEVFESHLYAEPTPPASLLRDCPGELSELILRLLAKLPGERPASAREVQSALVDILHGRPMQLAARTAEEIDAELTAIPDASTQNLTTRLHSTLANPSNPSTPRTVKLLLVAAAILLASIVAVFAFLR